MIFIINNLLSINFFNFLIEEQHSQGFLGDYLDVHEPYLPKFLVINEFRKKRLIVQIKSKEFLPYLFTIYYGTISGFE